MARIVPELPESAVKYAPVAIPVYEHVNVNTGVSSESEAFLEVIAPANLAGVRSICFRHFSGFCLE